MLVKIFQMRIFIENKACTLIEETEPRWKLELLDFKNNRLKNKLRKIVQYTCDFGHLDFKTCTNAIRDLAHISIQVVRKNSVKPV